MYLKILKIDRVQILAILKSFAALDMATMKAGAPLPLQSDIEAIATSRGTSGRVESHIISAPLGGGTILKSRVEHICILKCSTD
ncbi:hypothetical protein VE03_08006 [Pseudogymnoascus sp. 23342-1-I1]|nr:hypothetical protein VE03_08006 [Pseudogymnoascus sp. 23342-1-I1]